MKKLSIFRSLLLILTTILLLVSTMFAWYVSNKEVTATGISASVISEEGGGVSIDQSDIAKNSNIYPFNELSFSVRASQDISMLKISFTVDECNETEFNARCKNEYVLGKYNRKTGDNYYNYDVSSDDRNSFLWSFFEENKSTFLDYIKLEIIYNNKSYYFNKIDDYFESAIKILSNESFTLKLTFGKLDESYNPIFPSITNYGENQINVFATNYNCFLVGIKSFKLELKAVGE